MSEPFVPAEFAVPDSYEGPGFRLEPLGPKHNERDHVAWMASIDHIRSTPGFPYGDWPTPMDLAQNLEDLVEHDRDFADRTGFTYSILDGDEVVGCIYIYPTNDHEAEVRSWVKADRAQLDAVVWASLSRWIEDEWPFENPHYEPRA